MAASPASAAIRRGNWWDWPPWASGAAPAIRSMKSNGRIASCFQHPEPVGLARGEAFGGAPDGGLPKAVGHEPDVRLALLRQLSKDIPAGAVLPEEPSGEDSLVLWAESEF